MNSRFLILVLIVSFSFILAEEVSGVCKVDPKTLKFLADIPPKAGEVVILNASNFNSIAFDPTKDVLVDFYAPWCHYCKLLEPVLADMAQRLKSNNPNLIIAKFDCEASACPIPIQYYPTIKFYPGNNKQNPIAYNSNRDYYSFVQFFKRYATFPVTG